jgi:RNA polymerase sigma-70 factor (ECF subfamily)
MSTGALSLVVQNGQLLVVRGPPAECHTLSSPDPRAIATLFENQGPMVFRRALRLLGSVEDAKEATQEVFIRLLRAGELQPRLSMTAWLYQITTNYCLNQLRDGKQRNKLRERHVAPVEEAKDPRAEELALLRQLLAEADPREAEAAVFVFIDGMSHDEAAEVLGVSRRTVGNLLERFTASAQARMKLPEAK